MTQRILAENADCTAQHLNAVICGRKDAGKKLAPKLAALVGGTIETWLLPEHRHTRKGFVKNFLQQVA